MTPKIGLIICSQRTPRAGRHIGTTILKDLQATDSVRTNAVTLSLIDLAEWNLPLYNEPGIPSQIHSSDQYLHPHTRKWSKEIASHAAFVFVTPQYNWGYPASIKNAIDYLYHEWNGKPAMIVSYGGHGGGKAAEQLKQVLCGIRMRPLERTVGLTFPSREILMDAAEGRELDWSFWEEERKEVVEGFREIVKLLLAEA
ncbi:flavo protein-like protein [Aspergillus pseudotamarii]|uniref:Flavo protein-like protein n=1 Tax=Aspergillus pseudotamarii TaxID=132259 RepID=A0A5N6SUY2_ASPPS|nr:flavo protein-like protein [Aspergillus pseudotamarii]KAE8137550.1 flavo protein-like protein [Aspergillus pseudotamarii]